MSEKRIDAEDGEAYTWDEISAHYAGKYKKKQIEQYWGTMKPVKKKGKGEDKSPPGSPSKGPQAPPTEEKKSPPGSPSKSPKAGKKENKSPPGSPQKSPHNPPKSPPKSVTPAKPMKPVLNQVKELFTRALRAAFPSVRQDTMVVKGNPKFGDYQCNNAMGLFKEHGKTLGYANPGDVAAAITRAIPKNDILGEVVASPQGFISIKLSDAWITKELRHVMVNDVAYEDTMRKRVVVDFSSPNIAKEMHVGHLRSTIIGESMCRILEFCGHEVHRLNHVGDWGTQFGMLIEYMKEAFPDFQKQLPDVADLQEFYKASKKRFDEDETFKAKAQAAVVDLQAGGEFARSAWQKICDVSRKSFQKIYDRLDVAVYERGESFYNSLIPVVVKELQDRGICAESDGAMCIFTPRVCEIPLMAVKSDGGYGYDSTDLAAIYHRLFFMRADWIVYITDMGQESHFHMIFDAAVQAGWHVPPVTRCDHMGFGVVQGEDKKKFKTRSGETVKLVDLLDEAVDRAKAEITKRVEQQTAEGGEAFLKTPAMQQEAAERLGIAAVRYFDMKQNRVSPYVFNWDKMLDSKGNTATYLFFSYARICSIQKKAGVDVGTLKPTDFAIADTAERDLSCKLLQFPDVIEAILGNLHIHQLSDYLWELSSLVTVFITQCRVIGVPEQASRLLLCEASRKVFYQSFRLLGFTPLEQM